MMSFKHTMLLNVILFTTFRFGCYFVLTVPVRPMLVVSDYLGVEEKSLFIYFDGMYPFVILSLTSPLCTRWFKYDRD